MEFIDEVIEGLPTDLNVTLTVKDEKFEVVVVEFDEQWSFVGSKKNQETN